MALLTGLMKLHYSFKIVEEMKSMQPEGKHNNHFNSENIEIDDKERRRDGRHLRSSNDVFNFVKNNLSEGVKQAKKIKQTTQGVVDIYKNVEGHIKDIFEKVETEEQEIVSIEEPKFDEDDAEAMLGQISGD